MSGFGSGGGGSGFVGSYGGYRDQGDVAMRQSAHPTVRQALESAVALPGVFTSAEMIRTLRRNNQDVMKTALQLREKHAFRQQFHYDALNIGMTTIQNEVKKGYVHVLENACDLHGCPIVLLMLKYFKPSFSSEKTQLKGVGTVDGTSTLEDTRRACVYLTDLAVEVMEENKADGVVFIIDLEDCSLANLETKMHTDILQMLKMRYPEIVRHVLVINSTTITRGLTQLLAKLASERTQQRIHVLQDVGELRHFISPQCIPHKYGGTYRLMPPMEWMKIQAEVEEVDLESEAPAAEEKQYMTKDARQLNGMQYAACSVDQVVEMKTSVIRGPLYRNKSGMAWVKMYGILRPEALLMYEDVTSKMPQIIIPVNEEVSVCAAQFGDAPRGSFGFRINVPGVAGGHLLAAMSDPERGKWLQEIQMNIDAVKEEIAREQYEEEKRLKAESDFAKLNMISFDDPTSPVKSNPPQHQPQQQPQQYQQQQYQQQQQQSSPQQLLHMPSPFGQAQGLNNGMGMMGNTGMYQQQQPQQQGMGGLNMMGAGGAPVNPMAAQGLRPPAPMTGMAAKGMGPAGQPMGMNAMGMNFMQMPMQQQVRAPQPVGPMMGGMNPMQMQMGGNMGMGMPMQQFGMGGNAGGMFPGQGQPMGGGAMPYAMRPPQYQDQSQPFRR